MRYLALLMCICICLLFSPVSSHAAAPDFWVVSLGDSIARGYDCEAEEAYGNLVAEYIQEQLIGKADIRFCNFGTDGDTSAMLLKKLEDNDPIRIAVKNASLITISIGGNDLLQVLAKETGVNAEGEINVLGSLATQIRGLLRLMGNADTFARLQQASEACTQNMRAALDIIFQLNPNVRVILTTIPRPINDKVIYPLFGACLNGKNATSVTENADEQILNNDPAQYEGFNRPILRQYGYTNGDVVTADADAAFSQTAYPENGDWPLSFFRANFYRLLCGDTNGLCLNPHPTPEGQRLIAQQHYILAEKTIRDILSIINSASVSSLSLPEEADRKLPVWMIMTIIVLALAVTCLCLLQLHRRHTNGSE